METDLLALLTLSLIGVGAIFIFFLITVRTLGNIINHLTKIEFWVSREFEFRKEQEEVKRALAAEEAQEVEQKKENEAKSTTIDIPIPASMKSKK